MAKIAVQNASADQKKSDSNYESRGQLAEMWIRFKRNKLAIAALCVLIVMMLIALVGPFVTPYGMDEQNVYIKLQGMSKEHWFGTDALGRDVLTRIVYGARTSLVAGIIATTLASALGMLIGATAGYFGGKVDTVLMRVVELMHGIPSMLLAIVLCAALGASLVNCVIATAISAAPAMARMIRGQVLAESTKEYIEAEKMINVSNPKVILSHILPNISSTVIVQYTMSVGNSILTYSSLSFIGLGAQAPIAEWGAMLSEGRSFIRTVPSLCIFPGLAIMVTVFCFNILGDALRDALDPKLRN